MLQIELSDLIDHKLMTYNNNYNSKYMIVHLHNKHPYAGLEYVPEK